MKVPTKISRRVVLAGLPLLVAACGRGPDGGDWLPGGGDGYGAVNDNGILIPAIDTTQLDAGLLRTRVAWHGSQKPGTIVVNIAQRRVYLILDNGNALRYACGVGRTEGVNFRGNAIIGNKQKWPRWIPTAEMMAKIPRYRAYAKGLPGGLGNPLGARALYLYRDGHDTYFRLHGTNEPQSIGHAVSSGCIRLFNQDIIDLYNRVPVGTHVTVLQA